MCLAAVYAQEDSAKPKELVLDKVQVIDIEGEIIHCANLFGETADIQGVVTRIDLENSLVTIKRMKETS